MGNYSTLLRTFPVVRRLTMIQLLSYFGAWFSNVAIYALLIELDVSATLIALIAALHFLPGAVLAPFSGALIDSINPKRLMLGLLATEIISTLLLLAVQTQSDIYLLYILIIVRMGAASVYFTTEMSLLPKLLDADSLKIANELHSIIWSFCYTIGMALSGVFVYGFGIAMAFVIDAVLFSVSLLLLWKLTIETTTTPQPIHQILSSIKEGFLYLQNNRKIIFLLMFHATVGFTVFDALVALMAKTAYPQMNAALAIGFIHAVRAVALVIGSIALSNWVNERRLIYLFVVQGTMIIIWGLVYHNYFLGLVGTFLVGLVTTTLWSFTYTMIQNNTQPEYYGRVLAYNDMIFLFVSGGFSYLIGVLYDDMGLSIGMILGIMGGLFLLTALIYYYYQKETLKPTDVQHF